MSFFQMIGFACKKRKLQKYNRMKNLLWVSRCPGVGRIGFRCFPNPPVRKTGKAPFHVSFPLSGAGKEKGSASLEAALAVPLFLCFFGNLLALLLAFHTYSQNLTQLHQTGKALAAAAYEKTGEEDIIRLTRNFTIKSVFPLARFPAGTVLNGCCLHKWNGYDPEQAAGNVGAQEKVVYVAENGTVYHTDAGCTYLQLSINAVSGQEAKLARNQEGERYRPCELCGKAAGENMGTVYIAAEGNRYHTTLACSGLKRTIYTVLLSQTGGLPPCSRCGG